MKTVKYPQRESWNALLERPVLERQRLEAEVEPILNRVRKEGDAALRHFIQRFEGRSGDQLLVETKTRREIAARVDGSMRRFIEQAVSNVERYQTAQMPQQGEVETSPGVRCWWRDVPIERVGLYVPGGTAPLISTLIMLAVPARVAGCRETVVCSPPAADGNLHPALVYAAELTGVTELYAVGGAHAVAALAFGTETIKRVGKIFGPGNQYVTCAKQMVSTSGVSIDMPAGPSEVCVIADTSARADWVAADLLSQAEHGTDSQVLLLTDSPSMLTEVLSEIEKQLQDLPRGNIARACLGSSSAILLSSLDEALEMANEYAPEHLILALDGAETVSLSVVNAGSVFVGHYSPESAGDYASGTNHVLPTNGYSRSISGLGVSSFMKRISFQSLSSSGLAELAPCIEALARAEGLEAHRRAVSIRRES